MRILNLLPQGPQPYTPIHQLQQRLHQEIAEGIAPDTLILVEHQHTYTAGRSTKPEDIKNPNLTIHPADRGGRITYHGPGQLVLYPIFQAQTPTDVIKYVRAIERAVQRTLQNTYNLGTTTIPGRSGVWLPENQNQTARKICAIGVKFARDTTMHGLALNVTTDLSRFDEIVPCGISDAGVTSLAAEQTPLPQDPLQHCAQHLAPQLITEITPLRAQPNQPIIQLTHDQIYPQLPHSQPESTHA